MPENNNQPVKGFFDFLKDYIALAIVVFSFAVIIILIYQSFGVKEGFTNIKDIIGFFLPVVGTWMGTILAFYFTKENFESASRSMQQTINRLSTDDKLKSIPVTRVMITLSEIDRYTLKEGETWDSVAIVSYIDFLEKARRQRLVIFDGENKAKFVVHKSTLNNYIYLLYKEGKQKSEVDKMTIGNILASDYADLKKYFTSPLSFVSDSATLYEVQQKMLANPLCQDVFVTASGNSNESVMGWITNVIVAENAKV